MELYDYLAALVSTPTVSGFEKRGAARLAELSLDYGEGFFENYRVLPSGSLLFEHKCGVKNAKKLIFDAHMDTIGFLVSEHAGEGFVKVAALGGVDPYILPATPITLFGKRDIHGVFTSVPPHLAGADANSELKLEDLYVDTGLPADVLAEICPVGTPCGFCAKPIRLQNGVVASHSLDDKTCVAAIFHACKALAASGEALQTDVYAHLSVGEEKTGLGAKTLPYVLADADACIVLDVNFAYTQGVKRYESLVLGEGAGISYSATTHPALTAFLAETAAAHGLPLQTVVEMRSTGTNATQLHRNGIPCAVLSVPLKNMHTYVECAALADIESAAAILEKTALAFHACDTVGEVHLK